MQAYLTLTRRELAGYFASLTGYLVMAITLFQIGLAFVVLVEKLKSEPISMPITELFYMTQFFWLILLISSPVITMRLFALEKFSGTFETLMTAPVSDLQVVLSKFTAALIFYMVMWLPLLACILVLRRFTSDPVALDQGAMASTFAGIFLIGGLFMSVGCFASSLTRSQIVAAMITFGIGITLFMLSFLSEQIPMQTHWFLEAVNYVSLKEHMLDFSRGVLDTRHVIFYVSSTIFFLFLTHRVVESRRWK